MQICQNRAGKGREMLQLTIAVVFVIVGVTCALWVFVVAKLLPLYRSGAVEGGYRASFQTAAALLSWVTMQIVVWLLMHQDAAATMLSVLWAIGLLAWLTVATVARTRRQVRSETAQAHPQQAPRPQPAQPQQTATAGQRYRVRTTPHVGQPAPVAAAATAPTAPRSARVRRIMNMGASYGD